MPAQGIPLAGFGLLLIPQLLQEIIELGCILIPLGENLLGGDGVFLPEVFHSGNEGPLVLPQVAVELLGQKPLEPLHDQPLGVASVILARAAAIISSFSFLPPGCSPSAS